MKTNNGFGGTLTALMAALPGVFLALILAGVSLITGCSGDTVILDEDTKSGTVGGGGIQGGDGPVSPPPPTPDRVATPTAKPPAGAYDAYQTVTLSTTTAGATIYYTTTGTPPSRSSAIYYVPITVYLGTTLKAIAYQVDTATGETLADSEVLTAEYTALGLPPPPPPPLVQVAAPTASPPAGAYNAYQDIILRTTTPGATIFYTTNGSTPATSSPSTDSGGVVRDARIPMILKAIAVKTGMANSEILTAVYTGYTEPTPAKYKEMVRFPAGSMGKIDGAVRNFPAFEIGKYEVTYQLWKEVYDWATDSARGTNRYTFANPGREGHGGTGTGSVGTAAERATRPVTGISFLDAVVWCNAYSEMTGKTPVYNIANPSTGVITHVYRSVADYASIAVEGTSATPKTIWNGYHLPYSWEWEYAARGGDPADTTNWTYTYSGRPTVDTVAWYTGNSGGLPYSNAAYGAHPVGTKIPTSKGVYDLSGNVAEMCHGGAIAVMGEGHVWRYYSRGGSWYAAAGRCAVAEIVPITYTAKSNDTGFRVACYE